MAVAQYLEPGLPEFDLVVIDEASQMRPEDALGAVLRAKRFVVVGDPMQLPPTSFFDRLQAEEAGDDAPADDTVEGESILELCLRSFRPARRLRWHYRSRHESLIAFSNRHLYDDRLIIFPSRSASHALLGVELVEVAGRYEAGREKRINVREAVSVAETALGLLRDHPELTVGVVAVNEPQARLIEQEIRLRARGDEALEAALDPGPDELEPFFVKNLENVQGDERDVILVSLTYGLARRSRPPTLRADRRQVRPPATQRPVHAGRSASLSSSARSGPSRSSSARTAGRASPCCGTTYVSPHRTPRRGRPDRPTARERLRARRLELPRGARL
jgi:superfamily I DNA and/or RNA helicase